METVKLDNVLKQAPCMHIEYAIRLNSSNPHTIPEIKFKHLFRHNTKCTKQQLSKFIITGIRSYYFKR